MPWKECRVVDDRLRFVARVLDGRAHNHLKCRFAKARPEPDFK